MFFKNISGTITDARPRIGQEKLQNKADNVPYRMYQIVPYHTCTFRILTVL